MKHALQPADRISGGDALRGASTPKTTSFHRTSEDSRHKEHDMSSLSKSVLKPKRSLGSAALIAFLLVPLSSWAQSADSASTDTTAPSLQDLDQKIRILQRQLELRDDDAAAKAADASKLSAGADGFTLKSPDGNFILNTKGLLQVDFRSFFDDTNYTDVRARKDSAYGDANGDLKHFPKLANTFLLRKVRPTWDATLWKYYNFRLTPDFGGGSTVLLDAYGEVNFWPAFKLRVGKFTPPIGLERIQSASDNNFVEYNFPSLLAPQRDLGAQLSGDFLNQSVSYAVGIFNGAFDGANKDADSSFDKDYDGRIFVQPFKATDIDLLNGLGVGIAGSWGRLWGDSVNTNVPGYKTSGQNTFFSYRTTKSGSTVLDSGTVRAAGDHYRINPEAYWYVGPVSLFGEYILSAEKVTRSKPIRDTNTADKNYIERNPVTLKNQAWGVSASWVVTGEPATYKSVKPRHNLSPDGSGIGAIEIVARAGQFIVDPKAFPLYADSTASARKATSFGAGINWYVSRNAKWVLDYEHTSFEAGAKDWNSVAKDRDPEQVLTARLQLTF